MNTIQLKNTIFKIKFQVPLLTLRFCNQKLCFNRPTERSLMNWNNPKCYCTCCKLTVIWRVFHPIGDNERLICYRCVRKTNWIIREKYCCYGFKMRGGQRQNHQEVGKESGAIRFAFFATTITLRVHGFYWQHFDFIIFNDVAFIV